MTSDQFMLSIIAGLVSATVLGIVLWLIRTIWKNKIEPWWENHLYSDARVDGAWEAKKLQPNQKSIIAKKLVFLRQAIAWRVL